MKIIAVDVAKMRILKHRYCIVYVQLKLFSKLEFSVFLLTCIFLRYYTSQYRNYTSICPGM